MREVVGVADQEWPKKVRWTGRPDEEIEVGQAEYTDLLRAGLLVDADDDQAPTKRRGKES